MTAIDYLVGGVDPDAPPVPVGRSATQQPVGAAQIVRIEMRFDLGVLGRRLRPGHV